MKAHKTPLGIEIARLRNALGWSQKDLAERAGVNLSRVKGIEAGASQHPRHDGVEPIAAAFGLTGSQLLAQADGRELAADVGRSDQALISTDGEVKHLPADILDRAAALEGQGKRAAAVRHVHEYLGAVEREERAPRARRRPA